MNSTVSPRKKSRSSKAGNKRAVVGLNAGRLGRRAVKVRRRGGRSRPVVPVSRRDDSTVFEWPEVLLPWLIAECACQEVSTFLGVDLPPRYADWLTRKAEACYQKNRHFRRLMWSRGNAPREWLRAFMRHWIAALLGTERFDLLACLPTSFDLGQPLPPGTHPRINRRSSCPLPDPRPWRPELVLAHHRWRWLAE